MGRRAAKVTEDEVRRLVKSVTGLGLVVSSVDFDGCRLSVKIASSGDKPDDSVDAQANAKAVDEVPTL